MYILRVIVRALAFKMLYESDLITGVGGGNRSERLIGTKFRRDDTRMFCESLLAEDNTEPYLHRSASLRLSRYLSWQFLHAVVITSAASVILS
jgi:hypothetical protein